MWAGQPARAWAAAPGNGAERRRVRSVALGRRVGLERCGEAEAAEDGGLARHLARLLRRLRQRAVPAVLDRVVRAAGQQLGDLRPAGTEGGVASQDESVLL